MSNDGIQVLNISNVNALGKTVLNDGKLLELIQKYPFLYNPRVKAYNDGDYIGWAWKNINAEFNRSYANDPCAAFSTHDLMARWNVLKPLIQCLSKAYDLEAIPQYLRKSVVKITNALENQNATPTVKPYNYPQNMLLQNIFPISELSVEKKLALERDILDLILTSEMDNTKAKPFDDAALRDIQNDTEEFLNEIGFKQVLLTSITERDKLLFPNQLNPRNKKLYRKAKRTLGWVPLRDARTFVKNCKVRVERINIEDYLPLSKIKQMSKIKDEKAYSGSPGIFGI